MALAASGGARGGTGAAAPRRIALANYGGGEPNVAPQEGGTCGEPRGASRALRKPDRTAGLRAGASRFSTACARLVLRGLVVSEGGRGCFPPRRAGPHGGQVAESGACARSHRVFRPPLREG